MRSPGKKDRSAPSRLKSLLVVILAAAAVGFCYLVFSESSPWLAEDASAASLPPEIRTPEARRLLALLTAAAKSGGNAFRKGEHVLAAQSKRLERVLSALSTQLADSSANQFGPAKFAPGAGEQSAVGSPVSLALGEKIVKCEQELARCKADAGKKAASACPCAEDDAKKEQLIERVQRENRKLKDLLKKRSSPGKGGSDGSPAESSQLLELTAEVLKLKEDVAKMEEEKAKAASELAALKGENGKLQKALEEEKAKPRDSEGGDPGALRAEIGTLQGALEEVKHEREKEVADLKKQLLEAAAQRPAEPAAVEASANAEAHLPGFSADAEKQALEAAKKVIEECGRKQVVPGVEGGSKLYQCEATEEELKQYLNYKPREQCPDDWYFVQKLVYIKNCYCLPKRRCFAPSPPNYKEPSIPFPQSLFDQKVLQNENVRWTLQYWPSYEALNNRTFGDCRDCFDLTLENTRWEVNFQGTIPIEYMLSLKGKGSIKIGLDAGGGTGSFAAKMAQHGITIVTTAMNTETLGGDREGGLPYMETIAQRGLIPLFSPHKARQPFMDGTLDIIHNINSIKYFTIPEFEELLFEWDRILRPGGVLWFELFYAPVSEMPLYISVIEMFNYKKLYWNMTPKTDAPEREGAHVYLNCVLEKPRRPDVPPVLDAVEPASAKQVQ